MDVVDFLRTLESGRESIQREEAKAAKGEVKPEEHREFIESSKRRVAEIAAKAPEEPAVLTSAGRAMSAAGDDKAALEYLDKAVAREPRNAWALLNRGQVRAKTGDLAKAALDAESILKFNPDNEAARALLMLTKGRSPGTAAPRPGEGRGEAQLGALIAQHNPAFPHTPQEWASQQAKSPTRAGELVRESLKSRKAGRMGDALSYAEGAVKADPHDPMARFQSGLLLSQLGKPNEAVTELSKAIMMGWKDAVLFKLRAEALLKAGSPKAALDDADMAVRLDPKLASAYALRGLARVQESGLSDEVVADFKAAADLDPAKFRDQYEKSRKDWAELKELEAEGLVGTFKPGQEKPAPSLSPARAPMNRLLFMAAGALIALLLAGFNTFRPASAAPEAAPASSAPAPVSAASPNLLASHIRVERLVGQGGMGQVFEGWDLSLKRKVAIKKLRPEFHADPKEKERFAREAHTTGSLRHDSIPVTHELIEQADAVYIVTEFVEGISLEERLESQGRLAPAECLPIVKTVCEALDYAHGRGVIHRDLKPANIMLTPGGSVKVMDFGIARQTKSPDGRTRTDLVYGTPPYMAPEQSEGVVSRSADLYALGATLYQLLTGRLPFEGSRMQEDKRAGRFAPPSAFAPEAEALDDFFRKALAPKPEERFASGAELAEDFARRAAG